MSGLHVSEIHKRFTDDDLVLSGVSFSLTEGDTLALLGPSGCGKSTLLSIIAGLLDPDRGRVSWNGKDLAGVPPHKRGFGLMFQDYALFPHMRVRDNVAFGPRMQRLARPEIDRRVQECLELVSLPGFEDRDTLTLSGGEQQRVALARALALRPALLMLDEPLGSLDRRLRAQLLDDLSEIVQATRQTTLYVTHDQEEAFSLADKVVVLEAGGVAQTGTPRQIYQTPKSAYVARFIGLTNLIAGKADGKMAQTDLGSLPLRDAARGEVLVLIRPDAARLEDSSEALNGVVSESAFMGETTRLYVEIPVGPTLSFEFPSGGSLPKKGEMIRFTLGAESYQSFPAK
jgi:ABC-type Fe3+/spermidine/putrescine transport system ATPase subunit